MQISEMRNYEKIPLIDYVRDWELGFDEPMDVVAANFESVKYSCDSTTAPRYNGRGKWKIAPLIPKYLAMAEAVRWLQFLPQNEFNRHWLITGSVDRVCDWVDFTGGGIPRASQFPRRGKRGGIQQ
jgi:hypothetical protein